MVLFIACLAITVVAGKLKPSYGDKEDSNMLFNVTRPIVLTCTSDVAGETENIQWSKKVSTDDDDDDDDEDKMVLKKVGEIKQLKGRHTIIPKEGRFIIESSNRQDAGNYTCSLGGESFTFNVFSMVYVKVDDNAYVIEEERFELPCKVRGTKPGVIWEHRPEKSNQSNQVQEDNERIKLEPYNGVEDALLVIEKAKLSDRGYYTCIGSNLWMDEPNKSESFVRVKDKLAALWPFLGICAEVFLLCAIILIYEKRRNKTDLDESDTDQSPDQKNDHKDSDVRHRK